MRRERGEGQLSLLRRGLSGDHLLKGRQLVQARKAAVGGDLLGADVALVDGQAEVLDGTLVISGAHASLGHVVMHGATFLG